MHTGWAACVVASRGAPFGSGAPIKARVEIALLGDPDRFVFHRAAEIDRDAAPRAVAHAEREATARAGEAIARVVAEARAGGHVLIGCAIVAREGAMPALDVTLAAHPRIHTAEGLFYRDVLAAACASLRVPSRVLAPKTIEARAAKALRVSEARLAAIVAEVGRAAGKPWSKDQKIAALAAWTLLASIEVEDPKERPLA